MLAVTTANRTQLLYSRNCNEGGPICQGDVLDFPNVVPCIDEHGEAAADEEVSHWLVIGNTCDFHRDEVEFTQIVPVYPLPTDIAPHRFQNLTEYRLSREFYLPAWEGAEEHKGFFADFTKPVTMHKNAGRSKVVARMSREGWILLHSALVRFLARDDGRFDP